MVGTIDHDGRSTAIGQAERIAVLTACAVKRATAVVAPAHVSGAMLGAFLDAIGEFVMVLNRFTAETAAVRIAGQLEAARRHMNEPDGDNSRIPFQEVVQIADRTIDVAGSAVENAMQRLLAIDGLRDWEANAQSLITMLTELKSLHVVLQNSSRDLQAFVYPE
jgi:hypothetical protein